LYVRFPAFFVKFLSSVSLLEIERLFRFATLRRAVKINHLHIYSLCIRRAAGKPGMGTLLAGQFERDLVTDMYPTTFTPRGIFYTS
jgi:hypothetical protein